jgi:hypothetical protein
MGGGDHVGRDGKGRRADLRDECISRDSADDVFHVIGSIEARVRSEMLEPSVTPLTNPNTKGQTVSISPRRITTAHIRPKHALLPLHKLSSRPIHHRPPEPLPRLAYRRQTLLEILLDEIVSPSPDLRMEIVRRQSNGIVRLERFLV